MAIRREREERIRRFEEEEARREAKEAKEAEERRRLRMERYHARRRGRKGQGHLRTIFGGQDSEVRGEKGEGEYYAQGARAIATHQGHPDAVPPSSPSEAAPHQSQRRARPKKRRMVTLMLAKVLAKPYTNVLSFGSAREEQDA